MSNVSVKLYINGIQNDIEVERIVDNISVNYDKAREYLSELGIEGVESMTGAEVSENMYSIYCNNSLNNTSDAIYPTAKSPNLTYFANKPYPFGNRAVLELSVNVYYEENEKSTGFLPKGYCVANGKGSQSRDDTGATLNYSINIPKKTKFNKIKIAGNYTYSSKEMSLNRVRGNVIWGKTSVFNPSTTTAGSGGLVWKLGNAYYAECYSVGCYAWVDPRLEVESSTASPVNIGGSVCGGPVDDSFIVFDSKYYDAEGNASQGNTKDYYSWIYSKVKLNSDNKTFSSTPGEVNLTELFGSYKVAKPMAIYGKDGWLIVSLYRTYDEYNDETGKWVSLRDDYIVFINSYGQKYYIYFDGTQDPYTQKIRFSMLDGILYMFVGRYSGDLCDIYILKPDTGDYKDATLLKIYDTGLKTTFRVMPCNDGRWYLSDKSFSIGQDFEGKGFLVEYKPGLPLIEIDLKEPVYVGESDECSITIDAAIRPKSEES